MSPEVSGELAWTVPGNDEVYVAAHTRGRSIIWIFERNGVSLRKIEYDGILVDGVFSIHKNKLVVATFNSVEVLELEMKNQL